MYDILNSPEYEISSSEGIGCIKREEENLKMILYESPKESEELAKLGRRPKITNTDRLQFVKCMMSDDIKTLYWSSQDSLTRSDLDSQNSIMKIIGFYNKMIELFNDPKFRPYSEALPDLHEYFATYK